MAQFSRKSRTSFNPAAAVRGTDGFLTVSCAADPLDMRPAWDALEAEVRKRSGARPLVVVIGELHDTTAHKTFRQGGVGRLLNGASPVSLACGLEMEHNLVDKALADDFLYRIPEDLRERISGPDHDGRKLIETFHTLCLPQEAPAAYKNLMAFYYHNNIPVHANDVAKTYSDSQCQIDLRDPVTLNVLRRQNDNRFQSWLMRLSCISVFSPNGIARRNTVIFEQGLKDLRTKNVDVYVQDCGLSHLLGQTACDKKYKDSLTAHFNRAGVDVMPVLVTAPGWGPNDVPRESHKILAEKGLIVHGLSDARFFSIQPRIEEIEFLHSIRDHSGNEIEIYPSQNALHPSI
jgi:hypothetical protein